MASPQDLEAERNKIQREILALESKLGADSNIIDLISSGSDEDSDDSRENEEEVGDGALEAERQKIQREIEELEQTLGADASLVDVLDDSDPGTGSQALSSDEESDEDLPQDVETCLQLNLVYQEILKEKLADLERLLSDNRQQQNVIEAQLSGPPYASPGLPHLKLFLGSFMKPYFKDKVTFLGPPANEETKEKFSHGTRPCDEMKIRRWEGWQKTLLTNSVVTDTMKRMQQPKLSKMEYLNTKMSKAEEKDKEELRKQIAVLDKEITDIRSMKEEQLYGNRHDDHDWDKIANIDFEGLRQPEDLMRFWQNYLHPSINKSTWAQDEVEKLDSIVKTYNCCHWDQIAEALGTNRTAFMCYQTYQRYICKRVRQRNWTPKEDQVLKELVEKMRIGNFIPYTQMSYFMESRGHAQLMYRWTSVLDPSIKKGPWTKEEDQTLAARLLPSLLTWNIRYQDLLLKAVERYGVRNWWKIRLEVPGRTDNACRDRYLDCLRDGVKRGPWSNEEVELLKSLVEKYGVGKWTKIAAEIPNRIDSQCLHKWKWITRPHPKKGVKRGTQGKSKKEPTSKKRKLTKKKPKRTKKESEDDSTSEDEKIKVVYIDSDEERVQPDKSDVLSEENMEPREEYIQPDMKKWIPVCSNTWEHPAGTVSTTVVRLPTEAEEKAHRENSTEESSLPAHHQPVSKWITLLDHMGCPVRSYVGKDPLPLQKWDFCTENAMIKVPATDVKNLLISMGPVRKGPKIKTTCPTRSNEGQRKPKTAAAANLNLNLQLAVIPWVGSVVMPMPPSQTKLCEADIVRKRASDISLLKMPVFLLFLKALHIDAEGCKKVIETRKNTNIVPSTPRPVVMNQRPAGRPKASSGNTKTVAMLLAERQQQSKLLHPQECEQPPPQQAAELNLLPNLQQQVRPAQPLQASHPMIRPTLMAPQTFIITQPNTPQGKCLLQPIGQSSTIILSNSASPTASSEGQIRSKRNCKPKAKDQPLKNVRSKGSKSAKVQKGAGDTPLVPLLPKSQTWILTPCLVPVSGINFPSPVVLGNQNRVLPDAGPRMLFQPPVVLNKNGSSSPAKTVQLSSPTLPTAGTNLNLLPSSVSNTPNISTNPATVVSIIPSNASTSVPHPAIQVPPSKSPCHSKQGILNVSPQLTFQPPVIMNQNGSTELPKIHSVTRLAPVSEGDASKPLGTSQNPTSASSDAIKVSSFNNLSVSSVSVSCASLIPQVNPVALNKDHPVVQMPPAVVQGDQNQSMPIQVPQVAFQQTVLANHNRTMANVSTTGPCLLSGSQGIILSKVTPSSEALNASKNKEPSTSDPAFSATKTSTSVTPAPSSALKVATSVAESEISTITSSDTALRVSLTHDTTVPVQNSLADNTKSPSTPHCCVRRQNQALPQMLMEHSEPQAKNLPLQTETSLSSHSCSPDTLTFESNLMFLEDPAQVQTWMKGEGGISLPELDKKVPYLPPFVSSINTLTALLKAKESLVKAAEQLLPEEDRRSSEEETKVAAVRKLVSDRFKTNQAYLLLKARFLSCFTLPALLATINPCKEAGSSDNPKDDDDDDTNDEFTLETVGSQLNTNESEASASQFSGISTRMQRNSHNST